MTAAAATSVLDPEWVVAELDDGDARRAVRAVSRRGMLAEIAGEEAVKRAAECRQLVRITEWADLHRADAAGDLLAVASGMVPARREGSWGSCPVVMSGVPVEEFALAELATALQISDGTARVLIEDALELRERLPRHWARILTGVVPVWKARAVARRTRCLSPEAAAYVDTHLAAHLTRLSVGRITAAVDAAVQRFHPDLAATRAAQAAESRGVWIEVDHDPERDPELGHPGTGVGRLTGVADLPDLLALDAALDRVAAHRSALGDTTSHQVRRSKALGILADPQHALDLATTASGVATTAAKPVETATIHVHLHTTTEIARVQASGLPHTASPISRAAVERWLAELAPGVRVKVTPVIDLAAHCPVDAHEAPVRVRAQVEHRDHGCVFPWCTRRARLDLDHIEPYVHPDDGGPPGQTSARALAPLCRYHHRVKTHGAWAYRRLRDATYQWVSPLGDHFLVDGTGTRPLD